MPLRGGKILAAIIKLGQADRIQPGLCRMGEQFRRAAVAGSSGNTVFSNKNPGQGMAMSPKIRNSVESKNPLRQLSGEKTALLSQPVPGGAAPDLLIHPAAELLDFLLPTISTLMEGLFRKQRPDPAGRLPTAVQPTGKTVQHNLLPMDIPANQYAEHLASIRSEKRLDCGMGLRRIFRPPQVDMGVLVKKPHQFLGRGPSRRAVKEMLPTASRAIAAAAGTDFPDFRHGAAIFATDTKAGREAG